MARARSRRHKAAEEGSNERWLLTYADMITLLMALFMVLFSISSVRRGQRGYYGLHVAETVLVRPADAPWKNQRLGEMLGTSHGEVPPARSISHDQMTLTSGNAESAPAT